MYPATVMGMDLYQGGHLTHGSQFNISGKRYSVASYGVTRTANSTTTPSAPRRAKPKVIVAGFTSYPWAPDWALPADRRRAVRFCWPTSPTRPAS